MTIPAWLPTAIAAALIVALPPAAHAAADVQLRVDAGLAGLARPGRWTPVRVAVDNGREPFAGELVVEWGDARARRTVSLAPAARRQFEIYVRTMNVRDAVIVRLETSGAPPQRTEAPVRIVRFDEPLVICVGPSEVAAADRAACTATLAAESLPSSWRGYDAADDLVGRPDARAVPSDKQEALALWRVTRALEDASRVSRPREPEADTAVQPLWRAGLVGYLIAIPALLLIVRRMSSSARTAYAAVAALVVVATGVAFAGGRGGPGSGVTVRASAVVHQFPGVARSWILMRGSARFPTAAAFALRAPLADGAFETTGPRGAHDDQQYDDDGSPILAGRFALGARKAFALEGVGDLRMIDVVARASSLHLSNVSAVTLEDCSVRTGLDDRPLGDLVPGATLDIAGAPAGESLTLSCRAPASALALSAADRRVDTDGRLQLVVHLTEPHAS